MSDLNPNQYALGLHTTSLQLGLSLINFARETRSETWDIDRELSTYLHQYLMKFIHPQTWQDLTFIAVAKGPGSFTSSRIGVVTARTLAQQLNIPLFGISTLAAWVWFNQDHYPPNSLIPVQMKASRGQLYVAIYQKMNQGQTLSPILADTVMNPETWVQTLKDYNIDSEVLVSPPALGNTVTSLLDLAYYDWQQGKRPHWSEVIPFYGMSVIS
ncbi:peptidase M22 glycoprotease [Rippkaea orientalis PCC 8801]|uniref:Peptidase M22 glycoprotease n=1 Tax=Rippkaea orientalis (strain PCC 8801 / RF-1) TaxID=41431 RepID=B7JYU8_RIPO1|nr:tRNA (adenosine(37)-N6)-threonylcarbamoyltransferase complex dimerization subunit type 1 TsaB [Rippkaea orientalis]ACK66025.1 peptidase M22 glycoprotease [Rippkaea orientalis PCC 8801]